MTPECSHWLHTVSTNNLYNAHTVHTGITQCSHNVVCSLKDRGNCWHRNSRWDSIADEHGLKVPDVMTRSPSHVPESLILFNSTST